MKFVNLYDINYIKTNYQAIKIVSLCTGKCLGEESEKLNSHSIFGFSKSVSIQHKSVSLKCKFTTYQCKFTCYKFKFKVTSVSLKLQVLIYKLQM